MMMRNYCDVDLIDQTIQWSKSNLLTWLSYLLVIILCCIAAAGQGKEVQPLRISHEDLDSRLSSELGPSQFDLKEDDLFHVKTDDFFPKKLEKSFQKHRWKFDAKDFPFTPISMYNVKTSRSVPIPGNSPLKSSSTFPPPFHEPQDFKSSHHRHNNNNDDDSEEEDEDDDEEEDEDGISNLVESVNLNDISRVKPKIKNETELIGTELMRTPSFHRVDDDDKKIYSEQHKYYVPSTLGPLETPSTTSTVAPEPELDGRDMKDDAEMELFKISTKNQSDNDIFLLEGETPGVVTFPPPPLQSTSFPFEKNEGGGTESVRLIPQLVNVTTENVYVSLESDEELGDDEDDSLALLLKDPAVIDSKKNQSLQSLLLDSQDGGLEVAQFPSSSSVSTEPPFITVNSSGIFPESNFSSNFKDRLSKYKRKHHQHKSNIFQNVMSDKNESTPAIIDPDSSSESSSKEEEDEDEEEDGQGKTMMMRRRPRRSVVHLYDMVVCATGCNPLIYKGYGCFCGFMGSGIAVDGVDRCCFKHDWCYHHAKCPSLLTYFVPYYWTCNGGRPRCVSDFRGWKGICGAQLCECDRQFAECLRKYPCPRSRAMCMTSPWRFWQNIMLKNV